MNPNATAIIQARMTSTRLPGKVLMTVLGKPLLCYLVERLLRAGQVERIIVATTTNPEDDHIAELARQEGLAVFRGSEPDVLDRYYSAARKFRAAHILRITADCPLIDPVLVDKLVRFYFGGGYDYACNCDPPSLPDGLDAEVFSFEALETAHLNAKLPSEREHVTPYIRKHPRRFNIGQWKHHPNLSNQRWTVDEPEDFLFVEQVLGALYPTKPDFNTPDVLELLTRRPELCDLNSHYQRNEGLLKSQIEDLKYLKRDEQ